MNKPNTTPEQLVQYEKNRITKEKQIQKYIKDNTDLRNLLNEDSIKKDCLHKFCRYNRHWFDSKKITYQLDGFEFELEIDLNSNKVFFLTCEGYDDEITVYNELHFETEEEFISLAKFLTGKESTATKNSSDKGFLTKYCKPINNDNSDYITYSLNNFPFEIIHLLHTDQVWINLVSQLDLYPDRGYNEYIFNETSFIRVIKLLTGKEPVPLNSEIDPDINRAIEKNFWDIL